jgi:hypothetical protein
MNSTMQPDPTARDRRGPVRRNPAELAPSVERSWADGFVLEQRLLGVPGVRIGDALVTVESYVVESGQSAEEAFGDARAYARELARTEQPAEPAVTARTVVSSVLGVIGLLVTVNAFAALLKGERVEVTVGLLAAAVLLLVTLGAFLAAATTVLRVVVERLWLAGLALAVFVGSSVALMVLLRQVLLEVPAALLLGVGVLMLAADAVLSWTDAGVDDPVLAPGEEAPRRRTGRYTALFMPAAAVVMLAVTWALHALG